MRVAGFKPIEYCDIQRLKRMEDIDDDEEAKKLCLREFWKCEMRMPKAVIDELVTKIRKVWHPENKDWDRMYVEFEDEKSVKICFSYAKNLRNGELQILQYFSPEFSDQFRALDATAYQLRHPETLNGVKFKTRIRFGRLGLELEKRHPEQKFWSKVHVPHLPLVDLPPAPPPTISTSPPSSRARNKRPRSSPQSSPSKKSSRVEDTRTITGSVINTVATRATTQESTDTFKNLVDKFASQ